MDVEAARRSRGDACERDLAEAAVGVQLGFGFSLMTKAWDEHGDGAHSTKGEANLLYDFGSLSVGLGWRQEMSGRFEEKGWVVSARQTF